MYRALDCDQNLRQWHQLICWCFVFVLFCFVSHWYPEGANQIILNYRWQASVCDSGREWGMALQVANVWLFRARKEKISLSANNGETNSYFLPDKPSSVNCTVDCVLWCDNMYDHRQLQYVMARDYTRDSNHLIWLHLKWDYCIP